jgi:hypothetical protein
MVTVIICSTVNFQLFGSQACGILIQPATISKKIYHFYKLIQKQICDMHMFICHAALAAELTVILPRTGAITIETS